MTINTATKIYQPMFLGLHFHLQYPCTHLAATTLEHLAFLGKHLWVSHVHELWSTLAYALTEPYRLAHLVM